MVNYSEILDKKEKIAIIGMGYVGMPMAIAFSEKYNVIGFDINKEKIEKYRRGIDVTGEVGEKALKSCSVDFTNDEEKLKGIKVFIVAVPTPINNDKTPDLTPVENASKLIGRYLVKDSLVVYESTVYPGVTEDICVPILEKESSLKYVNDFKVAYSPERINPGDKIHTFKNIKKIVSGTDKETVELVEMIYGSIIDAGVYPVSSIKVAEAAKVVENSQRDINIAFMNELAMVFDKMGINTNEVIDAMNTKWNSLGFYPGLVGGHCIGVDPYYFIYEAEKLGYHSQIILSGRQINDGMVEFIGNALIKTLIKADKKINNSKVIILGATFKENCPDIRNSKVFEIVNYLQQYGINVELCDPIADTKEIKNVISVPIIDIGDLHVADGLLFAVAHDCFRDNSKKIIKTCLDKSGKIAVVDVKGIVPMEKNENIVYWQL